MELMIVSLDDLESFGHVVRSRLSQHYADDCPIDDHQLLEMINDRLCQMFDLFSHGPIGLGQNDLFESPEAIISSIEDAPLHDDLDFDLNVLEASLLKLAMRHPKVKEHFLRVAMMTVLDMTSDVVLHLTPMSDRVSLCGRLPHL